MISVKEEHRNVKVLDHGYVKYVDHMGSDETVVEAARMSTARGFEGWDPGEVCVNCGVYKEQWDTEQQSLVRVPGYYIGMCYGVVREHAWKKIAGDAKLLEFLYKNKHMTPFEMCELTVEVQAPIMVFREWHRHRTQSYNEFSARYAQMPNLHYLPEPGRIQKQSATNKQGSAEPVPEAEAQTILKKLADEQGCVYEGYDQLVGDGIAKEVARLNTPVSRYSKMRAKTDLRNWLGFLMLRKPSNAQWEIRQYANAVGDIVQDLYPRTYALFEEHDLKGVHLSRTEAARLHEMVGGFAGIDEFDPLLKKLGG